MVIAMGVSPSFANIRYKAPTRDGESAFGMGCARDLARGSAVDKALALRIIAGGASCPSSTRTAARSTSKSTARKRARAHAVQFAGHHIAHVGCPGRAVYPALSPRALRPARPRPLRRAERPLHDGMPRPRRACRARCARDRTGQLVWAFYGRHGRSMAWRQGAGAYRAARAHEYVDLFCGQDDVERAPQARAREGRCGLRRGEHGALVHQGIPRALAESSGLDAGDIRGNSARRLSRLRGSGPRHGPARVAAEDQSPDARHSRQARGVFKTSSTTWQSWTCPPVTVKFSGRPLPSTTAWIFVVRPPRLMPIA